MAIKELIVVLAAALAVFFAARGICMQFISAQAFERRRNVWLILTIAAFLLPSFWLYTALAIPLLAWLGRNDDNPQALLLLFYLLLPPFSFKVPMLGANYAFELTQLRIFVLAIIVPWIFRYLQDRRVERGARWRTAETFLILYIAIQIVFLVPYEDLTNTARRSFVIMLDSFAVLYFMSRIAPQRAKLVDVLLMLCLVGAIYALLAVFEYLKSWSLYGNLYERWGALGDLWNLRDGRLRALVSAGHALTLGYLLAMAFCFWLWFRPLIARKLHWYAGALLLVAGLLATNSRGPWLTAVLALLFVVFLTAKNTKQVMLRVIALLLVTGLALLSPLSDEIIAKIPFIGEDPQGNVAYRVRLAEVSWQMVRLNPFFGDPHVTRNLEELRQAQGIIDLVNAYATVAMFHGLVGLALYVGIFLLGLYLTWRKLRAYRRTDQHMERLGVVVFSAVAATMFFMATAGFAIYQYAMAGLLLSYAGTSAAAKRTVPSMRPSTV